MFYPDKIVSIKPDDLVLEIGPGSSPYLRSDVFLEYDFSSEDVIVAQRGHTPAVHLDKPVVYYTGSKFPFSDNEFDYVICSHVIEHVEDVDTFISELTRVAKKGYLEYPTIYYDYVYNISEHLAFIKYKDNELIWMLKAETPLHYFKPIHALLYKSLEKEYFGMPRELKEFMFEGFEWIDQIVCRKTLNIHELTFDPELLLSGAEKSVLYATNNNKDLRIQNSSFLTRLKNKYLALLKRNQ